MERLKRTQYPSLLSLLSVAAGQIHNNRFTTKGVIALLLINDHVFKIPPIFFQFIQRA